MSLRVLSLNVWALPYPVALDVSARMEQINAALPGLDADVVLYQEVWTAESREQLIAGGRAAGYAHVWHNEATTGGSGLLALSRSPFARFSFTRYTLCGLPQRVTHADYYSGKGFVELVIEWEGAPVTLFATHMHARYAPDDEIDDYQGHRVGEIIELAAAIRAVRGPIVAVGDFNLDDDSPEYSVLLGLTQLVDTAARLENRQNTATLANPYRSGRGAVGESRIDYVFTRAGERRHTRPLRVERVLDGVFEIDGEKATFSDHAGLIADVSISSRGMLEPRGNEGGAPWAPAERAAIDLARELLADGRERARDRRRFERVSAVASLGAAGAAIAAARRRVTRRRLIRVALLGGAAVATASVAGLLTLSERYVSTELAGFDAADALLDTLAGPATARRTAFARAISLACVS